MKKLLILLFLPSFIFSQIINIETKEEYNEKVFSGVIELAFDYNKSKNINYLQQACENAPFFGNPEMGKEISKLLGKLEILKKNCE